MNPCQCGRCGLDYIKCHTEKRLIMTENKKTNKKALLGLVALVAVIGVLAAIFFIFREKPVEGSKTITIEVVDNEQKTTSYDLKTNAEYLRQAMEETEGLTFSGSEGDYGIMIDTVNGVTADANLDGAYWSFYVNGGYCNYGIDTQPVLDGDIFTIKYEVYVAE